MTERIGSVVIESVSPAVNGGKYPAKRIVGEQVKVSADVFKEGHDVLTVMLRWRFVSPGAPGGFSECLMKPAGNDRWEGSFPLERNGRYAFTLEAWPDLVATWLSELQRKVAVGRDVKSELSEGSALLHAAALRAKAASATHDARLLEDVATKLRQEEQSFAVGAAVAPELLAAARRHPDRSFATRYERELPVMADRPRAEHGAWYEFFPRSAARDGKRHGTFKDAEKLLPEIAAMGFDVVYLPPIHPIGRTARKGKNNTLTPTAEDVGSPWAIGAAEGGHKAVHPALGTLEDFRKFREKAEAAGIEVALDLAYQCSPDHPYLKEHPDWFNRRPDGTIKTAENPPKRYEDIVNFDFMGPGRDALWKELKSVVLHWAENGVRIFRVDNPHTKPLVFWEWLIREVHQTHPDIVFLSEAFTRPKIMRSLAKAGFQQSYTYFTWRNFKAELQDYLTELTASESAEYMRGNLWPNTPDILPEALQNGGPPIFKIRFALAATLSSSYGIYSGFELCEGKPLPHSEEYADSEKFQLKAWDPERPGNIRDFISRLNQIRKQNPALKLYRNLRFYSSSNDRVLFYGKATPDGSCRLLMAVSLDPYATQEALLNLPLEELGIPEDETYQVHELMQDKRSLWQGPHAQVTLTPEHPCAVFSVLRFQRRENAFDYYE